MTDDEVFDAFTRRITGPEIRKLAGQLLFDAGSPLTLYQDSHHNGAAGVVIRTRLAQCGMADRIALVVRLLAHYGIPRDWIPPVVLVRDALALEVQQRRLLGRCDPIDRTVLSQVAGAYSSPEEVFALPYSDVERLCHSVMFWSLPDC